MEEDYIQDSLMVDFYLIYSFDKIFLGLPEAFFSWRIPEIVRLGVYNSKVSFSDFPTKKICTYSNSKKINYVKSIYPIWPNLFLNNALK